jgi:RimJ/RimL family protein N-acetyltransferase
LHRARRAQADERGRFPEVIFPPLIRTSRLALRRWHPDDATALQPILEANISHLRPWIPAHVAEPGSLLELADRLERFAVAFDDQREWRYAIFGLEQGRLLGEVSLFPRSAAGRVAWPEADEMEIGYWIRSDAMGNGYATEAAEAALDAALSLTGVARVTIRCDERNTASAAIPQRLGFRLAETRAGLQIWELVFRS